MSISKKYKIARAGTELGVFDLSAMAEGLKSGRFAWSDDCWGEGDVKWGKLSDIAGLWSDYLCLAGQVSQRIHVRGLGPATYSARLPF